MKIYGKMDMRGAFWCQRAARITNVVYNANSLGKLVYAKETDTLWYGGNSRWEEIFGSTSLLNGGQKMIFMSYPLPTNWTLWTDDINDRMILLNADQNGLGDVGGSWTITGMNPQNVYHNHYAPGGMTRASSDEDVGKSDRNYYLSKEEHRHSMAYDPAHTHAFDGSWRPALIYGTVGTYNG